MLNLVSLYGYAELPLSAWVQILVAQNNSPITSIFVYLNYSKHKHLLMLLIFGYVKYTADLGELIFKTKLFAKEVRRVYSVDIIL